VENAVVKTFCLFSATLQLHQAIGRCTCRTYRAVVVDSVVARRLAIRESACPIGRGKSSSGSLRLVHSTRGEHGAPCMSPMPTGGRLGSFAGNLETTAAAGMAALTGHSRRLHPDPQGLCRAVSCRSHAWRLPRHQRRQAATLPVALVDRAACPTPRRARSPANVWSTDPRAGWGISRAARRGGRRHRMVHVRRDEHRADGFRLVRCGRVCRWSAAS